MVMIAKPRGYVFLLLAFALLFLGISASEAYVKVLRGTGIGLYYPYFYLWLQFANFCAAGMVFGMENLLGERKQPGRWRVNPARLFVLGMPSFLMGAYFILWSMFPIIPSLASLSFADIGLFVNLMQMFFGYTVATSFYKTEQGGVTP
jgi:hypothetical protein